MKILITSDSHDHWENLEKAIGIGNEKSCEVALFAGDLIAPNGVKVLEKFNGKSYLVFGNNEGEIGKLVRLLDQSPNVKLHYDAGVSIFEEEIDGLKFYMNHYPEFVRNAALTGKHDVCIYGHDHTYNEETLENGTLLLNPGTVRGSINEAGTCMIFDTENKSVEKIVLE